MKILFVSFTILLGCNLETIDLSNCAKYCKYGMSYVVSGKCVCNDPPKELPRQEIKKDHRADTQVVNPFDDEDEIIITPNYK